jgi:hypothetical protein
VRRVAVGLVGMLLSVCAFVVSPPEAVAAPASCQQFDSQGLCVVEAGSGGSTREPSTSPVGSVPDSVDSAGAAANCTLAPSGKTIPCQDGAGWWVQSLQCYAQLMAEQPPKDAAVWGGHTDGAIYLCTLYSNGQGFPGTNGFPFWSATAPAGPAAVDPAVLAEQALRTLTIPTPTTGRYPAGTLQGGQPFTVVNAYTWFWTDAGTFQPLTATADAGGVWAQVTVTPTSLSFSPGDGSAAVSCPGPGVAWQRTDGVWARSPAGCDYRYPRSSIHESDQEVTAVYGIQWSVEWTSSTGASGTLPQLATSSSASFAVAEVQALVTG